MSFLYEFTAPALLMKLGIAGSALWLLPLLYAAARALRAAARSGGGDQAGFAAAGFVAFGLAVQSNPFLFSFAGMTALLFYFLWFAHLEDG